MKMMISNENLNENDENMLPLILRGVNVGTYQKGIYNAWYKKYCKKYKATPGILENYVCGELHAKLDIPIMLPEDIARVEEILRETEGVSIIEWFRDYIKRNL